jgi:simple sugar transport system permease protein
MKSKKMSVGQFNVWFEVLRFVLAIIIAFSISFIIMSFSTDAPFAAIGNLFVGPLTSIRRFSTVLETMIPLTFAGLAVSVMFKANQFNLAAEGALFMGALTAAILAIYMPGPPIVVIIASMLAAGIVGSLVCAIPGVLKIKWNCSEMVVSLMLNYVMLYFGTYIFNQVARDPDSAYNASYKFREGVKLSNIPSKTRLHTGLIIMVAFVILTYVFIFKTKWGYKLRMTGSNLHFAKCAGISVAGVIMSSQLIGGFIAGVGGSTEMLGMYSRFQWSALPGYGFDGVILNILAKENPAYIPVAAFFVAYLRIGADYMYKQSGVAAEIVAIIEGLVIVLVAATAFLSKFRHRMTTKLSKDLLTSGGER